MGKQFEEEHCAHNTKLLISPVPKVSQWLKLYIYIYFQQSKQFWKIPNVARLFRCESPGDRDMPKAVQCYKV